MGGLAVRGLGLWTPGFDGPTAWHRRLRDEAVAAPAAGIIAARQRRRLSPLSRAMITAFGQAIDQAGLDPADLPTVFGSAYGESATLLTLLEQLHDAEGELSPTRFAASVHNTASGALSIATGATGFTTSIAAGPHTLGACLCEAWALLDDGHDAVAVVVGDCAPPLKLVPADEVFDTLAVAIVLSPAPCDRALALLEGLRLAPPSSIPSPVPERLRWNPCAAGLLLIDAVLGGGASPVVVSSPGVASTPTAEPVWTLDVRLSGPASSSAPEAG